MTTVPGFPVKTSAGATEPTPSFMVELPYGVELCETIEGLRFIVGSTGFDPLGANGPALALDVAIDWLLDAAASGVVMRGMAFTHTHLCVCVCVCVCVCAMVTFNQGCRSVAEGKIHSGR